MNKSSNPTSASFNFTRIKVYLNDRDFKQDSQKSEFKKAAADMFGKLKIIPEYITQSPQSTYIDPKIITLAPEYILTKNKTPSKNDQVNTSIQSNNEFGLIPIKIEKDPAEMWKFERAIYTQGLEYEIRLNPDRPEFYRKLIVPPIKTQTFSLLVLHDIQVKFLTNAIKNIFKEDEEIELTTDYFSNENNIIGLEEISMKLYIFNEMDGPLERERKILLEKKRKELLKDPSWRIIHVRNPDPDSQKDKVNIMNPDTMNEVDLGFRVTEKGYIPESKMMRKLKIFILKQKEKFYAGMNRTDPDKLTPFSDFKFISYQVNSS